MLDPEPVRFPLALAVAWLAGAVVAALADDGAPRRLLGLGALGLATLACAAAYRRAPRGAPRLCTVLALFLASVATPSTPARPPPVVPGTQRIQAEVIEVRHETGGPRAWLRVEHASTSAGAPASPPGACLVADGAGLLPGERIQALVEVRATPEYRNDTPHPRGLARAPCGGRARPYPNTLVHVGGSPARRALERVRSGVREALTRTLAPRARAVAQALVLGDGAALEHGDAAAIRDAGLAHALAVSGMHITLLVGLLVALLERLLAWSPLARRRDPRRLACAAGIPLALLYAELAGGAPSARRAALCATLAFGAVALGRRPCPARILALVIPLFGALTPEDALRPAFLLSVTATASLLGPGRRAGSDTPALVAAAARTTLRAQWATAPIVLWCFESFPVAGLVANLVLLPLASLMLLPAAALHAAVASAAPAVAWATAACVEAGTDALVAGADALASLLPAAAVPPLSVAQGLIAAVAVAAVLVLPGWRRRLLCVALAAAALAAEEWRLRRSEAPVGEVRVAFLDVAQGDGALVDLPDGRLLLIDAGGGLPDPGRAVIAPLLAARRRTRIDLAVVTHAHPDHYGGLTALAEVVPITELWESGQASSEDLGGAAARLVTSLEARGTRIRRPRELCGSPRIFGAAVLEVLAPCPSFDSGETENDNSLVLRLTFGVRRWLFVGDLEARGEEALVARHHDLRADVLKVGHHGSRTSSWPALLERVEPSLAVVSAGAGNRFGHPHGEAIARLVAAGAMVATTAEAGGVTVRSNGEWVRARSWRDGGLEVAWRSAN